MDNFDVHQLFSDIISWVPESFQAQLKELPPETLYLLLTAAGCIALLAALSAFLLLRRKKPNTVSVPKSGNDFSMFFQKAGTVMDLAVTGALETVIGRAVVTKVKNDGIKLEIIEDTGVSHLNNSSEITVMFPPERLGESRVNSFRSRILTLNCTDDGCGRMILSPPTEFALVRRRRHKRKKVIDQQFIRVKIWLGDSRINDTSFADAAPDLAVNSYDPRSSGHESNQVINISNGGIGVSVHQDLVDKKFSINDEVLINIFMFNFRQKIFKPYWYAGKIRSIEELDGTNYRMGVQFTMNGMVRDENEQHIDWTAI